MMAQRITTIRLSDPLTSIRDDAHLKEALAAIDVMLDVPDRSEAQETYLSALTDLVETYETAHVVFPPRTGLDALRFLYGVE
jgi:antitoxin component HigA of HigAB toxin-antitoxin module